MESGCEQFVNVPVFQLQKFDAVTLGRIEEAQVFADDLQIVVEGSGLLPVPLTPT